MAEKKSKTKPKYTKKAQDQAPKAPPKAQPAPVAATPVTNPVGRPRNVVKLTETELSGPIRNFIANVSSRTGMTGDDIARVSLYMAAAQCQVAGPTVTASRMKATLDALDG